MTFSKNTYLLFVAFLFLSYSGKAQVEIKVEDVKLTKKSETFEYPPPPTGLKVSAYLIYEDSTRSTFDVLNDTTVVLWNTIIGGGDAEKPSRRTQVTLFGNLDSLKVTIYNGKKRVVNQKLSNFGGFYDFIIDNTGCGEVKVLVTKFNKIVYQGRIPFHCGE
ncbi:hypothetical protein [Ferruginibacter albus]|uniref:hypothetical protein n=1 Tax=Ferruginibacter albus TaxID=2875540 RepID=UPI001CC5F832|nr:hypothetical protein [Ferruginibacter albus]UAY51044.1 hypothetical protein K9M53_10630 [Ferruginibacter albus]